MLRSTNVADLAVPAAAEQVAFPVSGNGPVFYRHQALADQHGVADAAVVRRLLGGRDRRIARVRRKCASSSFFTAPRDLMKSVR